MSDGVIRDFLMLIFRVFVEKINRTISVISDKLR